MSTFTDYLEEKLLEHTFTNTSYTSPTNVYLGLFTVAPSDSASGTEVASANGYSRQACAFDAYSGGQIKNTSAETFTASGGNWGTVVAFGLFDASTGGNLLAYGEVAPNVAIDDGVTFTVGVNKLVIGLD